MSMRIRDKVMLLAFDRQNQGQMIYVELVVIDTVFALIPSG